MGQPRTAWHYLFCQLLRERAPRSFEIRPEVAIGSELPRADYLLLRKISESDDNAAETLRQLWKLLPQETVVEFKTTGRPYRRKGIHKLLAYTHGYYAADDTELKQIRQLACALIVPRLTPSLLADVEEMGLTWREQEGGYSRLDGAGFAFHVVELDGVTDLEDDDVLSLFSYNKRRTEATKSWWARHVGGELMTLQQYEDIDEVVAELLNQLTPEQRLAGLSPEQRLAGLKPEDDEIIVELLNHLTPEQRLAGLEPEQRLAGLEPEQRLAGLEPEQRLAGLSPEERLLSLPDAALRALSPAYVDGLPKQVREAIRARIGEPGGAATK